MVILFITSGLEPGKDGVGDYTRLLAAECIRKNQSSVLLALNDPFVSQPTESIELVDGVSIPTLRLPETVSWEKRSSLAADFRTRHSVDWISLQFVCYGFHPKGILQNKASYFEHITRGYPLHVMFHETWIGVGKHPSLWHRIVGPIQRHYIRALFNRLKPRLATTSNSFYVSLLQGIGLSAIETPLFGNIPVSPTNDALNIPPVLIHSKVCDEKGAHPDRHIGLFFGTLHPSWKAEPFMSVFASARQKTGKQPCIISAGRTGSQGAQIWEDLQRRHGHVIEFIAVGECTPRQVSALMRLSDFGLATTPWHLLGKSGVVAAMLDHGLPVIVTDHDFQPIGAPSYSDDPLVHRYDGSLEDKLWAGLSRRPAQPRIHASAQNLIDHFTRLSPTP